VPALATLVYFLNIALLEELGYRLLRRDLASRADPAAVGGGPDPRGDLRADAHDALVFAARGAVLGPGAGDDAGGLRVGMGIFCATTR
jgi:hypothetical protein